MKLASFIGLLLALIPSLARAAPECAELLAVLDARATYQTRLVADRPVQRDVAVEVEVRSTSTSAIGAVELAVFLGASMRAIQETRPAALPTRTLRVFEDGGLAFRAEVQTVIRPRATKKLRIERKRLPMMEDVFAVAAKIVGCRTLVPVAEGEITLPKPEPDRTTTVVTAGAVVLSLVVLLMLLLRLMRS